MKRKFTTCAGRIALLALLCLVAPCLSAQFSGEGSGTSSNPYRIYTAEQLYEVRNFLNNKDVYFSLQADIDLTEWIAEHSPEEGWQPIGSSKDSSFQGMFYGNGHIITGLWIDRPDSDNVGLFGCLGWNTVKGIRLYGAEIKGRNNVGGITGLIYSEFPNKDLYNKRIVEQCTVEMSSINGIQAVGGIVGSVTSDEVTDIISCISESNRIKGDKYVGGIVGYVSGYTTFGLTAMGISQCISRCKMDGINSVGGIIGGAKVDITERYFNIEECVSECIIGTKHSACIDTIGGIAGYIEGNITIDKCNANVRLYGDNSAGGIVGSVTGENAISYTANVKISNSYATGSIDGNSWLGGIAGSCGENVSISNSYSKCLHIRADGISAGIANVIQEPMKGIYNVSNSVAINDEIMSADNLARVVTGSDASANNNLAWDQTYIVQAGERLHVMPDDESNGTSTGLSALKQQTTYKTLGWDFIRTWTIQETVSLPYLQMQTAPAHISNQPKVGDTQISGQYTEDGIIRVCAGDSVYTAVSNGNRWTVTVDALQIGDVVSVSVQADGKMPSYAECAVVEYVGSGTSDDPYVVEGAA